LAQQVQHPRDMLKVSKLAVATFAAAVLVSSQADTSSAMTFDPDAQLDTSQVIDLRGWVYPPDYFWNVHVDVERALFW
jgi:hypothetical protein